MNTENSQNQAKIIKSEEEWKQTLTPEQFAVLREQATEPAFTGKYYQNHETGMFACAACGNQLFASDDKYDSGSGWPSFTKPVEGAIEVVDDHSHGMHRIEVKCARCGSHLGHVFPDGPQDKGGLRYCINSISLDLKKPE